MLCAAGSVSSEAGGSGSAKRARPAVGCGIERNAAAGAAGGVVDEVDLYAVEPGAELCKSVEFALAGAPVVPVCPHAEEVTQVSVVGALGPQLAGRRTGQPAGADAVTKVSEDGLVDVDLESLHGYDRSANSMCMAQACSPCGGGHALGAQ